MKTTSKLACPHCKTEILYEDDPLEMDDTMCVLAAWKNHGPVKCQAQLDGTSFLPFVHKKEKSDGQ